MVSSLSHCLSCLRSSNGMWLNVVTSSRFIFVGYGQVMVCDLILLPAAGLCLLATVKYRYVAQCCYQQPVYICLLRSSNAMWLNVDTSSRFIFVGYGQVTVCGSMLLPAAGLYLLATVK